MEWEMEKVPEQPLVYAALELTEEQEELLEMIVPGSTKLSLLEQV